jgi:hypothetical membrane protein
MLLVFGSLQFVVAMIVTQIGYGSSYSLSGNLISDLGVTGCGTIDGTGRYACSPWWYVFDASLALLGVLVVLAMYGIRTAFRPDPLRGAGLALVGMNGLGVFVAALAPENLYFEVHSLFAIVAFVAGGAGLVVLSVAMRRREQWVAVSIYTFVSGIIVLAATVVFLGGTYNGIGPGGVERVIVGPVLLWFVVVGLYLRLRTGRPGPSRIASLPVADHTEPAPPA